MNFRDRWGLELSNYDDKINRLTAFIDQRINHSEPEDDHDGSDDDVADLNKNVIPLAQSLMPIIKLSRLFLTRLAKDGLQKTPSKPSTDMNSYQLQTLSDSGWSHQL
jgi:hypothetical protein